MDRAYMSTYIYNLLARIPLRVFDASELPIGQGSFSIVLHHVLVGTSVGRLSKD